MAQNLPNPLRPSATVLRMLAPRKRLQHEEVLPLAHPEEVVVALPRPPIGQLKRAGNRGSLVLHAPSTGMKSLAHLKEVVAALPRPLTTQPRRTGNRGSPVLHAPSTGMKSCLPRLLDTPVATRLALGVADTSCTQQSIRHLPLPSPAARAWRPPRPPRPLPPI